MDVIKNSLTSSSTTVYMNHNSQFQSSVDFFNQAVNVSPVSMLRHAALCKVLDSQYHLLCAACRAHFSIPCPEPCHQYPVNWMTSRLGVRGLRVAVRRSTIPGPRFRIPSPKLDKQIPHRIIHEIQMPPHVNRVPHRRQNRDAGRAEWIPITTITLYVAVTLAGERGDEAGPRGQVATPASTQSSLHMSRERLGTTRALTLKGKGKCKVIPPRGQS